MKKEICCPCRFLPANEVALYARREALSAPAAEEGDDLRPPGGARLHVLLSVPKPPERPRSEVRPVPGHVPPPHHPSTVAARWPRPPNPRPPAPAPIWQLARAQPHYRGAQQNPGALHAEVRKVSSHLEIKSYCCPAPVKNNCLVSRASFCQSNAILTVAVKFLSVPTGNLPLLYLNAAHSSSM